MEQVIDITATRLITNDWDDSVWRQATICLNAVRPISEPVREYTWLGSTRRYSIAYVTGGNDCLNVFYNVDSISLSPHIRTLVLDFLLLSPVRCIGTT